MLPSPAPHRAAPAWIWLGVIAGAVLGGIVMLAIVRWLGGATEIAVVSLIQGIVPGLVYCSVERLRDSSQPYQPVTRRSLWLLVGFYGLILLALVLVDRGLEAPRTGVWLANFLVFTGSSWGSLTAPLLYEYRHRSA